MAEAEVQIEDKKHKIGIKGTSKFVISALAIVCWLLFSIQCPEYTLNFGIVTGFIVAIGLYYINKQELFKSLMKK